MMNFLVVGLESSCTRHISIMIAANLGFPPDWDGYEDVGDERFRVVHRSLPHGSRDNFVSREYWMSFDTVVLCTRDTNCSLRSKVHWHQGDPRHAMMEQERGRKVMSQILMTHPRTEIYSHESSYLIGRPYNERFFKNIGVPYTMHFETKEINSKYFPKVI